MGALSKIQGFWSRHRNKFIVGGIIVTGSILLTRQKIKDWQEHEAKEFIERTRKQQHFENTERTCNQTIINLAAPLNESLENTFNTQKLVIQLRENPENKVQIWENLKVLVFSRISCLIYTSVMLVITLRLQLNIVGAYLYKDATSVSSDIQQAYLSLCNTLLGSGVENIAKALQKKYQEIIGPIVLKRQIKLDELENIFWALQSSIATSEGNPIDNFREYVITDDIEGTNDVYNAMLQDTADLLDSDEVKSIATSCVGRGFALLSDQIAEYYAPPVITELPTSSRSEDEFVHPAQVQMPLAKLIPIINGLFSKKFPDNFIQQLVCNQKIKVLGANVYETFSHK